MAKIIAITNQKGGVGKTTTAINLAAGFLEVDPAVNVLLIDLDPQGHATIGNGIDKHALSNTTTEWLLGQVSAQEVMLVLNERLSLLPSNGDLTEAEVRLAQIEAGAFALTKGLEPLLTDFDYIVIDCPPTLNMLTLNALTAANSVLIPLQCEYYALEGVSSLLATIEQIRMTTNSRLEIEGILRTMFDGRNRLTNQVSQQLQEYFGEQLFKIVIPRTVRLAEAPSYGESIHCYDRHSTGAIAYRQLAQVCLARYRR